MLYVVLDFEATCEEDHIKWNNQEIIEFPMIVVHNRKIIREFHKYVKPVFNKVLTRFCTNLTGITQSQVDSSDEFTQVLADAIIFINELQKDFPNDEIKFVTCGDWDLRTMIYKQCKLSNISVPIFFKNYVNIKNIFSEKTGVPKKEIGGMVGMLKYFNIRLEGRHHSGIDDCRNIVKILIRL